MKKVIIAVASMLVAVSSYAQGTLVFNNRIVGSVDAKVTYQGVGVGAGYTAELLAGPNANQLTALTPTATFRTSPDAALGYINAPANALQVPTVAPGGTATVVMRALNKETYDASDIRGTYQPIQVDLGGAGNPPSLHANLVGLQTFSLALIPEPYTIALAVLGAEALFLRRRK
jgi:hypothetical protein